VAEPAAAVVKDQAEAAAAAVAEETTADKTNSYQGYQID
jgi:hypothetical protein